MSYDELEKFMDMIHRFKESSDKNERIVLKKKILHKVNNYSNFAKTKKQDERVGFQIIQA